MPAGRALPRICRGARGQPSHASLGRGVPFQGHLYCKELGRGCSSSHCQTCTRSSFKKPSSTSNADRVRCYNRICSRSNRNMTTSTEIFLHMAVKQQRCGRLTPGSRRTCSTRPEHPAVPFQKLDEVGEMDGDGKKSSCQLEFMVGSRAPRGLLSV